MARKKRTKVSILLARKLCHFSLVLNFTCDLWDMKACNLGFKAKFGVTL